MRITAGQKVINAYENYEFYFGRNDTLRVDINGRITSQGTIIGYFESCEDNKGNYHDYMILTLRNFKSQPNWKTHKKQLAKAANSSGYKVIFVPDIDIFYSEIPVKPKDNIWYEPMSLDKIYKDLIEVARYSQDKDIKTACCVIKEGYGEQEDEVRAYSYNQFINGEFIHAEEVVEEFCRFLGYVQTYYVSLLEPCYNCLKKIVKSGANKIIFAKLHKNKWNTNDFIELTNKIFSKTIKSSSGKPITFKKIENNKVNSFYKAKEA